MSDEDDDVSEGVFEFCHSYLGLLKQLNGCNPIQSQAVHVNEILGVILKKMKYDEDYQFDNKVSNYFNIFKSDLFYIFLAKYFLK